MTDQLTTAALRTARLELRRFQLSDAPRVAAMISDMDVHRWITRAPHPYTLPDAEGFIRRHAGGDQLVFATTLNREVIGCCSIQEELGYWLGKSFWGKGYATEAARALIARYFDHSAEELVSGYILGNQASANVLGKLGFSNAGVKRRQSQSLKRDVSIQTMTLDRTAWQAHT